MENKNYLISNIEKLGLNADEQSIKLIEIFYSELIEWNKKTNLTRITDEKDFIDKHILDSLSCEKTIKKLMHNSIVSGAVKRQDIKVIDIGTGAGFPLLPLWFFNRDISITLVDSVNKKLDFIRHFLKVAKENFPDLNIEKVNIVHSRAEDLAGDKNHREKYDIIVSRALSRLSSLIEMAMPFLKKDGVFLALKSAEIDEEVKEASKINSLIGGGEIKVEKFQLLDTELMRSFVIIKKVKKTSEDFPRRAGLAQKSPII